MNKSLLPPAETKGPNDLLFSILEDLGEEVRKRRDPEYIFASAALASFGAVALAVASLTSANSQAAHSKWVSPPFIGTFGICLITFTVIFKMIQDHRMYMELRREQVRITGLLAESLKIAHEHLPERYRKTGPGRGYLWSILIVAAGALSALAFCFYIH